jgi:HK97 family phage prohead protease
MKATELRCRATELEMRGKPGEGAVLSGYVAVFDQPSDVLWEYGTGHFVEKIDQRAFNKTVREADVRVLRNHDPNYIVGRSKAGVGNVRLTVDETGLYHELDVPDTATARSMYEDVQAGFIDQMSFAFRTIEDSWSAEPEDPKVQERRLVEVALDDVSYVAYPAYPQTTANARAALRSYARAVGVDVDELPDLRTTATTQEPSGPPPQEAAPEIAPEPEPPEQPRSKFIFVKGI